MRVSFFVFRPVTDNNMTYNSMTYNKRNKDVHKTQSLSNRTH